MLLSGNGKVTAKSQACFRGLEFKCALLSHTHTHTHTHIYMYAFIRHFYPKRLAFRLYIFLSVCVFPGIEPTTFALLTQCSTPEPKESGIHTLSHTHIINIYIWKNLYAGSYDHMAMETYNVALKWKCVFITRP